MKDFKLLERDLQRAMKIIPDKLPRIIGVEGTNFINDNFKNEGWEGKKWKKRKTTDKRGRDITRYRTSRRGAKGSLTQYGYRNQGRAILVGHNSGGNKLKNSIKRRITRNAVYWTTYKEYGARHNEGIDGMPQRQFMGPSKVLTKNISKKLKKELDKLFKK